VPLHFLLFVLFLQSTFLTLFSSLCRVCLPFVPLSPLRRSTSMPPLRAPPRLAFPLAFFFSEAGRLCVRARCVCCAAFRRDVFHMCQLFEKRLLFCGLA
jgi:hypothetical protein